MLTRLVPHHAQIIILTFDLLNWVTQQARAAIHTMHR